MKRATCNPMFYSVLEVLVHQGSTAKFVHREFWSYSFIHSLVIGHGHIFIGTFEYMKNSENITNECDMADAFGLSLILLPSKNAIKCFTLS